MPRGTQLSEDEIRLILSLRAKGATLEAIAAATGRVKSTISCLLKNPLAYGKKKRPGRPEKLTRQDKRRIFRLATAGRLSSAQIQTAIGAPVTARTIRHHLQRHEFAEFCQRQKQPPLTDAHKFARLEFAKKHVDWGAKWRNVIFSDEKKFNLDGPDGVQCYWHDLRTEPETCFSRQQGGGSLMVWAGFGHGGRTEIMVLRGRQSATDYIQLLERHLLPHGQRIGGRNWVFQQDNAAIHTARVTKDWFARHQVTVLDWPARSPDLNPIENAWSILVRRVYTGGRQFSNVKELEVAVTAAWNELAPRILQKLANSMKDRLVAVIAKAGRHSGY